jgi:hypothetical protein
MTRFDQFALHSFLYSTCVAQVLGGRSDFGS